MSDLSDDERAELDRLRRRDAERSRPPEPARPVYPEPSAPLPPDESRRLAMRGEASRMPSDARGLFLLLGIHPDPDRNGPPDED